MAKVLEEIAKEAALLPKAERLALAGILLDLEDGADDLKAAQLWEEEIQYRIQAVDNGTAVGIPYEDVMKEVRKRLVQ
jgi:hypothetical protein